MHAYYFINITKCPAKSKRKSTFLNIRVSARVGFFSRLGLELWFFFLFQEKNLIFFFNFYVVSYFI